MVLPFVAAVSGLTQAAVPTAFSSYIHASLRVSDIITTRPGYTCTIYLGGYLTWRTFLTDEIWTKLLQFIPHYIIYNKNDWLISMGYIVS